MNEKNIGIAEKSANIKNICIWFSKNWHYLTRFTIAFLIVFFIGAPLANNFNKVLDPTEIKDFTNVTVTEKTPPQKQISKDVSRCACEGDQSVTEIVRDSSSAPRVWVYGLRILGLFAALGSVLWAVVALCRE